ncbi:MAG: alginate lyase family protein [Bacteroidota bacterium]
MNIQTIKHAWQAAKDHGMAWTIRRVLYEAQLRTGHHKRILPKRDWKTNELKDWLKEGIAAENILATWRASNPKFFFSNEQQEEIAQAIREVNPNRVGELLETDIHQLRYFSKLHYEVSYPDIWFTNPFLNPSVECKRDLHWSDYPMYSTDYEDLKFIWESGRFAIVYDLARAYFLSKEEKFAEQYWQLIESWIDHNPPNTGPHWKCGQETSLRLMAWYFGLFAFIDSPATTPKRFEKFLGAVAVQVYRVSKDYRYSYIQQSNHAVSEGLGLYVTSVLFPQLKDAEKWRQMGKSILEDRALFLFRPDGTYFQKSHNYLRFIVHAYLYILCFAKANQDQFSQKLEDRMRAALDYLKAVMDEKTGGVPNFGSNDGALILPINSCDFTDYRPTIAALHYYFHQERYFANGTWNEDMIWLFGNESIARNQTKKITISSRRFDHSGIFTLRSKDSWCFVHAESIKDRPAHADALHMDFWWRGINICGDAGTYLYYGHHPWLDAFKHTRFHNTITIDQKDQMERMHRFTWGYWHDCQLNSYIPNKNIQSFELEHYGYHRLKDAVTHRRAILCTNNDFWLVIDDTFGAEEHEVQLNWSLADFPIQKDQNRLRMRTPEGNLTIGVYGQFDDFDLIKGGESRGVGFWKSDYYGYKKSCIRLSVSQEKKLPMRFISCFGAEDWLLKQEVGMKNLSLKTDKFTLELELSNIGEKDIIRAHKYAN